MIPPWLTGMAAKAIGGAVLIAMVTSTVVFTLKKIEHNGRLQAQLENSQQAVFTMQAAIIERDRVQAEFQLQLEQMQADRLEARQELERLDALFARHDLEKLARAKPDTVARLLTAGSARINCLLERASGAHRNLCPGEASPSAP